MSTQFYVTNDGLAASLASPDVLTTMRGVLVGKAHPMTVRAFHKRGFIALDKRTGPRTDHNTLVLTGAVDRVRDVLLASNPPTSPAPATPKGRTAATYTLAPMPEPSFSPTVEKVRAVLKEFEGREFGFKDVAGHASLKGMNPGTLRWAIQVLRRAGICKNAEAA